MRDSISAKAAEEIKNVRGNLTSGKAFREWEDEQFLRVMFFKKNGAKYFGRCECGETVELPTVKGGEVGECPACGRAVVYRSMTYYLYNGRKVLSVLERHGDGLIQRMFVVYKMTELNGESVTTEYREEEEGRYYFDLATGKTVEYHLSTAREWKKGRARKHGCSYSGWRADEVDTDTFPVGGWDNLLAGTSWQYSALEIACKKMRWQPLNYLYSYFKEPKLESLLKIGLYGLAKELVSGFCYGNERQNIRDLRSPKAIGIRTAEDYQACAMLSWDEIKARAEVKTWKLKAEQESNAQIFMCRVYFNHGYDFKYAHITNERLFKYWEEQAGKAHANDNEGIFIRDYADYVRECEELRLDLNDTAIRTPKDFQAMHERTSAEVKVKRDKETDKKIRAFYKEAHDMTEWTDGRYSVIMPKTAAEIIKEGKEMHHCVGGYCGRVANRDSVILFIRKNENSRAAFVTMEIRPDFEKIDIVQVRAERNEEPTSEVKQFLEKYKKWFNHRNEKRKTA